MPSVKLELGRYVVLKKRAGGTVRAYYQVPKHLRPSGWSPAIPLPRTGDRTGLLDGEEVAAIQRDAKALYREMMKAKTGDTDRPPGRSLQTLIDTWQRGDEWRATTEKTREGYGYSIKAIQNWSAGARHPDPATITREGVQAFLRTYDETVATDGKVRPGRPTMKLQVHKALCVVMDQAVNLGWRADNPARTIKVKVPKTQAVIWEQADVDLYVAKAREAGMTSIALIILLEWEIGQRLTDVRQFRPGMEYDSALGQFSFRQSKTNEPVTIPISATLRAMLDEAGDGHLFLFRNERTKKAYTENRLSKTFGWIRVAAVKAGGRALKLRQLRHSCIVQLARAGCTVPEIASITGHTLASVHSILGAYLPRDSTVARNAQLKRGIV